MLAVNKIDLVEEAFKLMEEIQKQYGTRFVAVLFGSAVTNEEVDNLFMGAVLASYRFAKSKHADQHWESGVEKGGRWDLERESWRKDGKNKGRWRKRTKKMEDDIGREKKMASGMRLLRGE
jgi:50S ribosomal subunit-associated GTPase HflX